MSDEHSRFIASSRLSLHSVLVECRNASSTVKTISKPIFLTCRCSRARLQVRFQSTKLLFHVFVLIGRGSSKASRACWSSAAMCDGACDATHGDGLEEHNASSKSRIVVLLQFRNPIILQLRESRVRDEEALETIVSIVFLTALSALWDSRHA